MRPAAAHRRRRGSRVPSSPARFAARAADRTVPAAAPRASRRPRRPPSSRRAMRAASGLGSPRSRESWACNDTSSPESVRSSSRSTSLIPREMSRSPGASSTRRSWARIRSADSNADAASPSSACRSASMAKADDESRATGADGRILRDFEQPIDSRDGTARGGECFRPLAQTPQRLPPRPRAPATARRH